MTAQDCPNCHYPTPNQGKKEEKQVPQSLYHIPEKETVEECAQCFYQPEEKPEQKTDDCAQCFYPSEGQEEKKDDGCSQCFYQPGK